MEKETSKLEKLLSILRRNGLLIICILAGLDLIREFTISNIIINIFTSIMFYGIFIWGYKKQG